MLRGLGRASSPQISPINTRAYPFFSSKRPCSTFGHALRHHSTFRASAEAQTKEDSSEGEASAAPPSTSPATESATGNFVPVMNPEDLPKGYRKVVRVDGVDVLLFWYRNQIYCIEARSPAEGAYSEGFENARLNQDFCIACPSTGTLFSLKTGEIVDWYPNNPVLKVLTPQGTCRNLDIFPVKMTQEAISVDVSGVSDTAFVPQGKGGTGKGGSDSSIDRNNVFAEEQRPYYEGQNPETGEIDESAINKVNPFAVAVSAFSIVFAGVAGSAFAIYKESYVGLGILWTALLVVTGYSLTAFTPLGDNKEGNA